MLDLDKLVFFIGALCWLSNLISMRWSPGNKSDWNYQLKLV